jgi:glycosyltransferase involved in cell wall biosynthesis
MLGWEFPPFISGGLGTACYGLTKALDRLGIKVSFCLPRMTDTKYSTHIKLLTPSSHNASVANFDFNGLKNVAFRTISSPLQPYSTPDAYQRRIEEALRQKQMPGGTAGQLIAPIDYAGDMFSEVQRYAAIAAELAEGEHFDIVHDRSGENVNQPIYNIERWGMEQADKVIAVSFRTRNIIISRYGIGGEKVEVVHNAVEHNGNWTLAKTGIKKGEKIVLFLGRITMQKGPEYFLAAAKKVLEVMDNVKFVMAGSGDLMHRMVEMAAQLGIGQKVLFTGFLNAQDVQNIYKMADLYVMPSVSEPFGIAPLEALANDIPVIISKQSGVSEVLTHALKVDFWDVDEIANKIIAVLKYPPLGIMLQNYGNFEVRKLRWKDSGAKCAKIYEELLVTV